MKTLTSCLLLLVSLLTLAGCGLHLYNPQVMTDEYPYRHKEFDYRYIWKTVATEKGLVVEGFVQNVRYASINDVEITVAVLDKSGKVLHKASDLPMPQQSREGELCNFSLLLKNYRLTPGAVLLFHLNYTGSDGEGAGFSWNSSFKVDAATGSLLRP